MHNKYQYIDDLRDISPEDALNKNWVDSYKELHNAIWWEIVRYNTNLFILNKISKFPFKTFNISFHDSPFWINTKNALVDSNILIIWRIVADTGKDVLTIRKLKNSIRNNLIDAEIKDIFERQLSEIKFDKAISILEDKIKYVRKNHIAHFINETNIFKEDTTNDGIRIMYSELNKFSEDIEKLFSIISFGHQHSTQALRYLNANGNDTDIDNIFDGLVRNSNILNMKEEQPEYFDFWVKDIEEKNLNIINKYRKKFGMTEL